MFLFSSKKYSLADSGLLKGFTDWHCHLLPGVDDGVRTMHETLDILAEYENQGVERVWLTPHVMEDVPNTPEGLAERFEELKHNYQGGILLNLASEHMLDNMFDDRLAEGRVMPIGPEKELLLVETSYFTPPYDMDEKLEAVKKAGFYPLLAHPERYVYMTTKDYKKLLADGIRLQLNIYSLVGMYGEEAKAKANWLLKHGAYSAIGTDTHSLRQFLHALSRPSLTRNEIDLISKIPR